MARGIVLRMIENVSTLGDKELQSLKDQHDVLTFATDFVLVYEKQIPQAAIIVVEGTLELIKNTKVLKEINAGHLLGLKELLEERPVRTSCRIKANSKIILLGKSHLLKSLKDRRSPLYRLLNTFSSSSG